MRFGWDYHIYTNWNQFFTVGIRNIGPDGNGGPISLIFVFGNMSFSGFAGGTPLNGNFIPPDPRFLAEKGKDPPDRPLNDRT